MNSHSYKKFKNDLRKEFSYSCVYCNVSEPEMGGSQSFHIDHYRPKCRFPRLIATYSNLLYACRDCNQYKGNHWPNFTEELLGYIILNPRVHEIEKHIDKNKFEWMGVTKQGKWNIYRLKLSSTAKIRRRENKKIFKKQF